MKRLVDIAGAGTGLVLASPILAAVFLLELVGHGWPPDL